MTSSGSSLGKTRAEADRLQRANKMCLRLTAKRRYKLESLRLHRQRAHCIPSIFLPPLYRQPNGGLAGPGVQHGDTNFVVPCPETFRDIQCAVVNGVSRKPLANVHRKGN